MAMSSKTFPRWLGCYLPFQDGLRWHGCRFSAGARRKRENVCLCKLRLRHEGERFGKLGVALARILLLARLLGLAVRALRLLLVVLPPLERSAP